MLNYYENILDEDKALMREQYKKFYPDDGFDFDKALEEKQNKLKEGTDNTAAGRQKSLPATERLFRRKMRHREEEKGA